MSVSIIILLPVDLSSRARKCQSDWCCTIAWLCTKRQTDSTIHAGFPANHFQEVDTISFGPQPVRPWQTAIYVNNCDRGLDSSLLQPVMAGQTVHTETRSHAVRTE